MPSNENHDPKVDESSLSEIIKNYTNHTAAVLVAQIKEQVAEMEALVSGKEIPEAVLKHINNNLEAVFEHSVSVITLIKIGIQEADLIELKNNVSPTSRLPDKN